jgi:hypothetical protein
MAKYRKKPVVIDAVRWMGNNFQEVSDFTRASTGTDATQPSRDGDIAIVTLEDGSNSWIAKHVASMGDWIIRGVANEVYACKPDIFDKTYEAVEG